MQESYSEGLASHTGPESCGVVCKDDPEALTGVRAGWVLSRETKTRRKAATRGCQRSSGPAARLHRGHREREMLLDLPRSKTPRMYGNILHGNRESRLSPAHTGNAGRIGKSKDARR